MIIDFHVHHYPERYLRALEATGSGIETYSRREDERLAARWLGGQILSVPHPVPDARRRLDLMDELGIDVQVLSIPSPSAYFLQGKRAAALARNVNEELAEFHRIHPTRFEAMAMLPMLDPDLALDELERALRDLDMRGTMVLTHIAGTPLDDQRYETFWARADELGLLVHVHPTAPPDAGLTNQFGLTIAVGFLADTTVALARLAFAGVFERYRNIRWVFAHLGGTLPFLFPRVDAYYRRFPEDCENISKAPTEYLTKVMYDTVSTHGPALRCACETFGASQLVFGSDFPHVPGGPRPFLAALDALDLTERDRAGILGRTAQRLLKGTTFA